MDDLQQVRDRHDSLPDPDPETITRARARLIAHMRETPSGKRSRRPVWGLGLAAAATAAALVAALVGGVGTSGDGGDSVAGDPAPVRLRPVASAQDLAANAAIVAAAEPDTVPKPHQWAYLKSLHVQTAVDGSGYLKEGEPKVTSTGEVWSRVDDWGYADYRNGKLKLTKGSERTINYQDILALPRDPDKLLARIYGMSNESSAGERNTSAFIFIGAAMRDSVLPSRLRAALYGAMAKIPDVRYKAGDHNLGNRRGVTLYRIQDGSLRDEIFIDPKTYEYLGNRSIAVKTVKEMGTNWEKGDIISWGSHLKSIIVDQPGQRS